MDEREIIARTPEPRTRATLAADLRALGLSPGDAVLAHSSLSSLGWVCGGPVAVVQALMDALTEAGTLVMPAHTGGLSDPAGWENPPVPRRWWETIQEAMPAFDPATTPTHGMGAIPEAFRRWPGVLRSGHPHVSFAAWGRHAERVTGGHSLDYSLGEGSPLARLYELDAKVLLLGVGYESNTSFHLAEYRAPGAEPARPGAPVFKGGERVWTTYKDIELHEELFPEIGARFEEAESVAVGRVGSAEARLFSQREAVDHARAWLERRRAGPGR